MAVPDSYFYAAHGIDIEKLNIGYERCKADFSKYESPIQKIMGEVQSQMIRQEEEQLMMQVKQSIGYAVDKDELLKALQYDRKQYEKGYKDALKALKAEVKNSPYTKSYEHETEYIPKHRVYEIIDRLRGEIK